MSQFTNQVLEEIATGRLLPAEYYSSLDVAAILDLRDSDPDFNSGWSSLYKQVEAAWSQSVQSKAVGAEIQKIRKASFLWVSEATSQGEIASYVSDDLELISKAAILSINHPFIEQLWSQYKVGKFPHPIVNA